MQENASVIPATSMPVAGKWQSFLWWLATADKTVIRDCVADKGRYAIVGMTVLGTWLFATLAWTYFFSTVTNLWYAYIPLGIFMGGIVLSIDRALIRGIRGGAKWQILPILLRGMLALVIGLFMAQPALLFLFRKDIAIQTSLDQEKRTRQKRALQDSAYATARQSAWLQKTSISQQLDQSQQTVNKLRNDFIAETDGTGGSKKIGLRDIAKAKELAYEKAASNHLQLEQRLLPSLRAADSTLSAIEASIQREQQRFGQLDQDGFLTRIESLQQLVSSHTALAYRYYLLVALLMLIELMPVMAKMMLPKGSYEEKMQLKEAEEITTVQNNHARKLVFLEKEQILLHEKDLSFMEAALTMADEKRMIKTASELDNTTDDTSMQEKWRSLKRNMLFQEEG